jgi:hypothetical protein
VPGPSTPPPKDHSPTEAYPGHGFADGLSLAAGTRENFKIQLRKLSLFSAYTCLEVNASKCSTSGALWRIGNVVSLANMTTLLHQLHTLTIEVNKVHTPSQPSLLPNPIKY